MVKGRLIWDIVIKDKGGKRWMNDIDWRDGGRLQTEGNNTQDKGYRPRGRF